MPADYRTPNTYVEESLLTNVGTTSATAAALIVGAAGFGPIVPTQVESWNDYVTNFGGSSPFNLVPNPSVPTAPVLSYLPYQVYSYFQNGGRPAVIQRATSSAAGTPGFVSVLGRTANVAVSNFARTSNVATITTAAVHGLVAGQRAIVDLPASYDQTFDGQVTVITAPSTTTITYASTGTDVAALSGAAQTTFAAAGATVAPMSGAVLTVSNKVLTSNVATITTSTAHGFTVGQSVTVTGVDATFNVTNAVITARTGTTFSYAKVNADVATASATGSVAPDLVAFKVQSLSSGSSVNYVAGVNGASDSGIAVEIVYPDTASNIFHINIYNNGIRIEPFQYLTMSGTNIETKAANTALSSSGLVQLVSYNTNYQPASLSYSAGALSGGTDPGLPTSADLRAAALAAVSTIDQPLLVCVAGYLSDVSDTTTYVSASLSSNDFNNRQDIFVINDNVRQRTTNTAVLESSATYGVVAQAALTFVTNDSYVASYTPWITIADPKTSSGLITIPPGGSVAGVYSRTDASTGVFRAPAGIVANISNAIDVDTVYTNSQLGLLNSINVNVIRRVPAQGICIMGARTRKPYGADRYVSARRTLIFIKESLRRATQYAVFENNDQRLWTSLMITAEGVLRPLWEAGGLAGGSAAEGYFINCDSSTNTPVVIAAGETHMEIGVALESPAEFIIIRVSQSSGGAATTDTTSI